MRRNLIYRTLRYTYIEVSLIYICILLYLFNLFRCCINFLSTVCYNYYNNVIMLMYLFVNLKKIYKYIFLFISCNIIFKLLLTSRSLRFCHEHTHTHILIILFGLHL